LLDFEFDYLGEVIIGVGWFCVLVKVICLFLCLVVRLVSCMLVCFLSVWKFCVVRCLFVVLDIVRMVLYMWMLCERDGWFLVALLCMMLFLCCRYLILCLRLKVMFLVYVVCLFVIVDVLVVCDCC